MCSNVSVSGSHRILKDGIVHLAYFDEAGTDGHCPFVIVGAVVFPSGSFGWVERYHNIAIEQIVPANKIDKFQEFHASELYLGKGAFEGIEEEKRFNAIRVLLTAMKLQQLPYIYAAVDRKKLAKSLAGSARPVDFAFRLSALGIEEWARSRHPQLKGTIRLDYNDNYLCILDDNQSEKDLKTQLRSSYRSLRAAHLYAPIKENRLLHAHDAMFFADSRDSIGIQMADICNYFMSCHLQGIEGSEEFYEMFVSQAMCATPQPEWSQFRDFLISHSR